LPTLTTVWRRHSLDLDAGRDRPAAQRVEEGVVARDGWSAGWTTWESSRFTTPFARTEENKFSELPELDNIDFFRPEMRKFVDSIRTGAPVAVPVTDALDVARVVDACYRPEQARGADTPLEHPT
jgi:predicted dehydrogenase